MSTAQTGWRALAYGAALALATTAAGCGGADGGDDAGDAETEQRVEATYLQFVKAAYGGDAKGGCALMSDAARKRFMNRNPGVRTCEKAFSALFDPDKLSENRPSVLAVEVKGNRAVAVVKTRNSDRYRMPMVREGNAWKLNGGF